MNFLYYRIIVATLNQVVFKYINYRMSISTINYYTLIIGIVVLDSDYFFIFGHDFFFNQLCIYDLILNIFVLDINYIK